MFRKLNIIKLITQNWKAKLVCLLIGFLVWLAVKSYLRPNTRVLQRIDEIKTALTPSAAPNSLTSSQP